MLRLLLIPFLLTTVLLAQDSLSLDLSTVTVEAYRERIVASRVAASVAVLERAAIEQYSDADLLPAMNRIPGVRFEQRAPGSYRVSVRGSTLRSPFGVRNLKVYWNGVPLTEPGGDTQLNFLDVTNVDRLELLKGPAGSLYGAGTAGTLLLSTDSLRNWAEAEVAAGSFGAFQARARVRGNWGNGSHQLRYAHQRTDGYRDHSSLNRHVVQGGVNLLAGTGRALRLDALYTDLSYDLPGGLNAEQLADDRRQARPGSAVTNASINYQNLLLGLTQDYRAGAWTNQTTAYATGFRFDHPFNFDYKRESNLGSGIRSAFDRVVYLSGEGPSGSGIKLSAGAEYQYQYRMANNFTNEDTRPGDLNFSDEIDTRQGLAFAQAIFFTPSGWRVTAALSANQLDYDVDRTFDADGNTGRQESDFGGALSPRLAVLRELGDVNLYASVARGFSPPTLDEFRTNEGSINTGLAPESGNNYEVGAKGSAGKLSYEIALYQFNLSESITTFSDERDTRLFRNAGGTRQRGVELAATCQAYRWLGLYGSYAYQGFSYAEFVRDGEDVSGQPLPGSAPHTFNLVADFTPAGGFYANLNYQFTDETPLNDANTVFGEAYHLLRARAGYRWGQFEVYAVGNNLLDQKFSFGNDLNPRFGGRYFQPAAGVNGLVGVRWRMP